ncbi:MAG TPA: hypothetical protein VHY22_04595 [Chthoniobacteraceae bacterium]|jgi:energy-coupling factor transporter ATP-binding protein EcfA2|nr:hypothetical protein [Chthoniobacteraceae bacterium]
MSRVTQIDLCDYRAFPGPAVTTIHLRGEKRHLLLYGENGSGKSSFGRALKDFFDVSQKAHQFGEVRNVFTVQSFNGGNVTLRFADDSPPPLIWSMIAGRDGTHPLFNALCAATAWLDYERLRTIYQLDRTTLLRDIFPLCKEVLLRDVPLPTRVERFGREWANIEAVANGPRGRGRVASLKYSRLQDRVNQYNTSLAAFLPEWQDEANKLLVRFVDQTEVRLSLDHPGVVARASGRWTVLPPRVILRLSYRNHEPGDPVPFLNEARLTACSISLWLAALLRSRPLLLGDQTYPRLLVLDDVLLSLDMEHRLPLLEVLREHFAEWQVILLTHNRAWYEVAKRRLPDKEWQHTELYGVRVGDYESPVVVEDEDHLYHALRYIEPDLTTGEPLDVKAAAVHVRTKFELILKAACEELSVAIPFERDPKKLTLNSLWGCLASHKDNLRHPSTIGVNSKGTPYIKPGKQEYRPVVDGDLADRVSHGLSWVLNPLSHSESVERYRGEIFDAIFALDDLERVLDAAASKRVLEIKRAPIRLMNILRTRETMLTVAPPPPNYQI